MSDSTSMRKDRVTNPAQPARALQLIFYNNPDRYPPLINSVRLLCDAGFQIDLFCRDNGENWGVQYPASARLHRLRSDTGSSLRDYGMFLARVLRLADRRAGVFVGHDMHGLLPARLLATLYRRPMVYHCHDYIDASGAKGIATKGVKMVRDFEQRFARTASKVIVPDAERAKVMRRELRLRRPPLIVANAPLKHALLPSVKLRESLASRGKHFERIVFRQGRIGEGHAIEATLRSIPLWNNRRWGFVVMGMGDESFQQHLLGVAQTLRVEEQFVILPPVGYDQVGQFTAGADVGHSLYEPIHINNVHISTASNKIMEYMAAGLPLLVSDTPSLRALVEKHACGVTADETSPQSIADGVNRLLGNVPASHEMGLAARRAFEKEFCYDRQFAPALEAMRKLIGGD